MDEYLFTDPDAILREAERLAAHTGGGAAAAHDPSPLHEPRSARPPSPIIVYLVDPPPEVDDDAHQGYDPENTAAIVESLPQTEEEVAATPPARDERETAVPRSPAPPKAPRRTNQRGILVGVFCLFLAVAALTATLLTLFTASATVTIIPQSREISATTTFTLVTTGTVNPLHHELPGRVLSSLTLSQAQTVQTTGKGHEAAQVAHGLITFYNAQPSTQMIPAGTLLTGTSGIAVVTDEEATLPPAVYPSFGQVRVPAQATVVGPAGNLRAGDIYGPCCRLNVSAVSGAFSGGQDARSYPVVTAHDLAGAVSGLRSDLAQSAQAAFQAEIGPNESLLAPRCTPQVTSNHGVGDEATHLSVTVSATCTDAAYDTQALTQAARQQLGTGYRLSGQVQATVLHQASHGQQPGGITLQVRGTGAWTYQLSKTALAQLAGRIAGKSKQQATQVLLHTPGVSQVSLSLSGGSATLPTDAKRIQMLVLLQGG